MRKCLTDLMKENENLKRDLNLSRTENSRLKQKIAKLTSTVNRLSKKVEKIKKRYNFEDNDDIELFNQ